MTAGGAQLADVQLVVADWYRKRLGTFLRRTLNQGLGAYLIFAVSLTTAAIAGRLAWVGGMEDRSYLSTLMKTEVQPQSEATRGVVLSLLLAGLNEAPLRDELYCKGPKVDACELGTRIWSITQGLMNAVDESSIGNGDRHAVMDDIAPIIDSSLSRNRYDALSRRLVRNLADRKRLLAASASIGVELRHEPGDACGAPEEISKRANTFFLAAPWCLGKPAGLTLGLVPQQSADALDIPLEPEPLTAEPTPKTQDPPSACQACCCCEGEAGCTGQRRDLDDVGSAIPMNVKRLRDFRVLRGQLDSELFDLAVESLQDKLNGTPDISELPKTLEPSHAKPSGPTIAAAFFISVDSLIRYWTRSGEVQPKSLPAHRLWAARPYFETMLNNIDASSPLITLAYMDFAGHGVVYTECQPLTGDSRNFPLRSRPDIELPGAVNVLLPLKENIPRIVVGAVCVDYALSDYGVEELVKKVNDGPVADAALVIFGKGAAGRWSPEPLGKVSWADEKELTNALDKAASAFGTDTANRRDVQPLAIKGEDASTFLVPLRVRRDGKFDAIVLRVGGVGPLGSRPEAMIVTILAGAIALGSLLAGFRSSKAVATREQLLGRLRSLQIGVIQTDADERITAANDRAEELLDRALPPFGIEGKDSPKFWDVFDANTILLHIRSSLNASIAEWNSTDVKLVSKDKIKMQRYDGRTTAYFVRLRESRGLCRPPPDASANDPLKSNDELSRSWVRITAGPILRPPKRARRFWARGPIAENVDLETFGVVAPVSVRLQKRLNEILFPERMGSEP